jgi:acetyl-CoA C-acetyltransferase
MNEVVIVSAVRTPIGILNGGLSSLPAHELGAIVIEEALARKFHHGSKKVAKSFN